MNHNSEDSDWLGVGSFDEDTSLYIGQGTQFDQSFDAYHLAGCTNFTVSVEECYYCSGRSDDSFSLSSPTQFNDALTFADPSPTDAGRYTYTGVQALTSTPTTSPAALAASCQLRLEIPQRSWGHTIASDSIAPSSAQTPDAASLGEAQPYPRSVAPVQHGAINRQHSQGIQSSQGHTQRRSHPATSHHAQYQQQLPHQASFGPSTTYLATPQSQAITRQEIPQISIDPFGGIHITEYTNNPRNVENLVQGTQIGGHRYAETIQPTDNSSPLTPRTPGANSVRSGGSSQRSRRTGSALRDPSLPHYCTYCFRTFPKAEDLRRHSRTHTSMSDRPHQCPEPGCPWGFVNPKDLRRHTNCHHRDPSSSTERFYCSFEDCVKSYTRLDNLRRHVTKDHDRDSGIGASSPSMSRTTSHSSYYAQPYQN